MKKTVPFFALLLCFLILILSSCGENASVTSVTSDTSDSSLTNEETQRETNEDLSVCLSVYGFYSLSDFETYCRTGSQDPELYEIGPSGKVFPVFQMMDGAFVDPYQLFPLLNADAFAVDYIEIVTGGSYYYTLVSNDKPDLRCIIFVSFLPDKGFDSIEKFAHSSFPDYPLTKKIPDNAIFYNDFFEATEEQLETAKNSVNIHFAFPLNDRFVRYSCVWGKLFSISIDFGDYVIRLSSGNPEDELIASFAPLFTDGEERAAAIDAMADFLGVK